MFEIDRGVIDAARGVYNEACVRLDANTAGIAAAETKLAEAVARRNALVEKAGGGEVVAASELRRAEDGAREAEAALAFGRDVTAHLARAMDAAHDRFVRSHHEAAAPVVHDAGRRLIEAARRRDAAMAQAHEAEAVMEAAAADISTTASRGYRLKHSVSATKAGWGFPEAPGRSYLSETEAVALLASAGASNEQAAG